MAEEKQNQEGRKPSSGEDINLKNQIESYFSTGNSQDAKTALDMCRQHGIDPKQFQLYHKSEEDKPCSNGTSISIPNSTSTISLVNSIKGEPIPIQDSFPYKERELLTLSKPSLVNIINGCFSSYSSKEIMSVFNPKEYLGKMAGIVDLKKQTSYLHKIKLNIEEDKLEIDEVFDNILTYLDNIAYKHNSWAKQAISIKDIYSIAKNEQKNRVTHISELNKKLFIESILYKKIDSVSNHNYIHKSNFIKILENGTKTGYVAFLLHQLNTKWNNLDYIQEKVR